MALRTAWTLRHRSRKVQLHDPPPLSSQPAVPTLPQPTTADVDPKLVRAFLWPLTVPAATGNYLALVLVALLAVAVLGPPLRASWRPSKPRSCVYMLTC